MLEPLAIAVWTCSAIPAAANLPEEHRLLKWDFESDLPDEHVKRIRTTQGGSLVASTVNPFEGKMCAVIRRPAGFKYHSWMATEPIPVEPGERYTVSMAYRNPNGAQCGLQIRWLQDDGGKLSRYRKYSYVFSQKAGYPFAAWDVRAKTVTAPKDARFVQLAPCARGEVYFDLLLFGRPDDVREHGKQDNLAQAGQAKCWAPNSGRIERLAAPARYAEEFSAPKAIDMDDRTYWVSNVPTDEPPKDIGIEWHKPVSASCVVVKYPHAGCRPPQAGERLQCWRGDNWVDVEATVTDDDRRCIRRYSFPTVETTRLRLYITRFAKYRPSVKELEVYAKPKKLTDIADHFDYTPPVRLGGTRDKPIFLSWYNPRVGFVAAEAGPHRAACATEMELSKVEAERAATAYLKQFRSAGFGGLLARHGLRPFDEAGRFRQEVEECFQRTNLPLKRHFQIAEELGIRHNFLLMMLVGSWAPGKVPEEIQEHYQLVKIRSENGERMVIDWLDDPSWERITANTEAAARLAKQAGAKGMAYDIECYGARGFYESPLYDYPDEDRERLLSVVQKRGRQLAAAIAAGFPGAEIVWLAGYIGERMDLNTALVKGLTSVESGGLHIFAEGTYFSTRADEIASCYKRTWDFGLRNCPDKAFWRTRCGVAPGTMPICAGMHRHLSPQDVATQLQAFATLKPPPKYIWIYSGWYPFMDPEFEGYRRAFGQY